MVHNPQTATFGDVADMERAISRLRTGKKMIVDVYERRTGRVRSELEAMMDRETWMDGQQAVEEGFADHVKADMPRRHRIAACLNPEILRLFKHAPANLKSRKPAPVDSTTAARLRRLGIIT